MKLRMRRASARLGAVAALAVVGSLSVAVPAFAADDQADLSVSVAATTVAVGGDKLVDVRVDNHGPAAANGVTVVIDAAGLDTAKVGFDLSEADWASSAVGAPAGVCTASGTKATCTLSQLAAGGHDEVEFTVTGVAAGAAGALAASVTSGTTDPDTTNNSITRSLEVQAGDGVDMVAVAWDVYLYPSDKIPVMPGTSARLIFGLANSGTVAAEGVRFTLTAPEHTTFAFVPSICDLNAAKTVATCADETAVLPAGQGFLVDSDAFRVRVAADAPAPAALKGGLVEVHALGEAPATAAAPQGHITGFSPASDQTLSQREIDAADNTDAFAVFTTPAKPIDMSALTQPAEGAVGETVEVSGVVSNNSGYFAPNVVYLVVAPTGTRITSMPENCQEMVKDRRYVCSIGDLLPGPDSHAHWDVTIPLKIVAAHVGTDGYLAVASEAQDPDPANNKAAIVVTVTGTGGAGGGLPITGARAGLIGGTGGAVLLAGAGVLLLARRRRVVMVTPADAGE